MSGEYLGSESQHTDVQDEGSIVSSSIAETADLETATESEDFAESSMTEDHVDEAPESDVPNPFLVDDPDEPDSESSDEDDNASQAPNPSEDDIIPADEIALAQSTTNLTTPTSALLLNKPTPPTPEPSPRPSKFPSVVEEDSSSSEDDDSPLEMYLPGLVLPTMFHPLPNTDPLATLLTKYIPAEKRPYRDLSGDNPQRHDFHTLVMNNNWRAIAKTARDRIVSTDPSEVSMILNLWYIRLAALARLRLFGQTTAECNNLFAVLESASLSPSASKTHLPGSRSNPSTPATPGLRPNPHAQDHTFNLYDYIRTTLLPFELLVLRAKTKYWAGDHMGYLDELRSLFGWCKTMSKRACVGNTKNSSAKSRTKVKRDEQAVAMWKERGARLILIMASQLIEMKDYTAAIHLLNPLASSSQPVPQLQATILRMHLQSGVLPLATEQLQAVLAADASMSSKELKVTSESLLKSAEGKWDEVEQILKEYINAEKVQGVDVEKSYYVAINNLFRCVA
ncbi:hypothetical protein QCA50_009087 [Cerrena zonata]|uniref:Uncharacterized protein n=1 Tax=Cerrena zonata TaxID=2478898 RepID=A0AAW0G3F6_9APHY